MARYYVNDHKQENGDYVVHREVCEWMPRPEHATYVGNFSSCIAAVKEARKIYRQSNGCIHCSPECHTS